MDTLGVLLLYERSTPNAHEVQKFINANIQQRTCDSVHSTRMGLGCSISGHTYW